jgi:hypothetical protein
MTFFFQVYGSHFKDGAAVREAISQYDVLQQKSCVSTMSTGRNKNYKCTDASCPFLLKLLRKRPTLGQRNSSTKSIPEGYWYVSFFQCHSPSCVSIPTISAKHLAALPAFSSAVQGSNNKVASESLLKKVVSETYHHVQLSHNMIQRARDVVRNTTYNGNQESYSKIPSLCAEISKSNPGSRICLQLDKEGRFFRFFILLQSSLKALEGCLPILEIDGTFMKHHTYNGICVVIVSKTGEKKMCLLLYHLSRVKTQITFYGYL